MQWPALDTVRLRGLPFWADAVSTACQTAETMQARAELETAPLPYL